ncbi:MAG: CheB methylesterase domain-containing protein [Campylobacterota bacterium]
MYLPAPSKIVLIGASTGGPGVIEKLISGVRGDYPCPICIVQHFPSGLSSSFASRLQNCTSNRVVESSDRLVLERGMVVVAHGGYHLTFTEAGTEGHFAVRHLYGEQGKRHDFIPSVDDMFFSAADLWPGKSILAILLTGIGDDGVEGMVRIASKGGMTICQDEKSSPVFGMPARAIEKGAAGYILSPEEIIRMMDDFVRT